MQPLLEPEICQQWSLDVIFLYQWDAEQRQKATAYHVLYHAFALLHFSPGHIGHELHQAEQVVESHLRSECASIK